MFAEAFETLIAQAHDGVMVADHDGRTLLANPAAARITGYAPDELATMSFRELARPEDHAMVAARLAKRRAGGPLPNPYETVIVRKGGGFANVEVTSAATTWRGEPAVLIILRDITSRTAVLADLERHRQHLESLVEERTAGLRFAHEELSTILRTAMDGFWITDLGGRFLEANDAYCALIGYSREELLSMSIADVEARESSDDVSRHIEIIMKAGRDRFQTRHRCKDGRYVDVEVSVTYLQAGSDKLIVFVRDITDRLKAERHQSALLGTLQDALAHVKLLSGLLPICASCKKIRDDKGSWTRIEQYVVDHSEARFSHSCCPECMAKLYPEDEPRSGAGRRGGS